MSEVKEKTRFDHIRNWALYMSIIAAKPDRWREWAVTDSDRKGSVIDRLENRIRHTTDEIEAEHAQTAERLAELERALAAKDAEIGTLRDALTPFALAAEDASVQQAGQDFVLHIRHISKPEFLPLYVNGNARDWRFLDASHLSAAAEAMKAGAK